MVLKRLLRRVATLFLGLSHRAFWLIVVAFLAISYGGLYLSNETALLEPNIFFYWVMVSVSTVGYGDFSPVTTAGRYFTVLWVFPVGLSIFAIALTKLGMMVSQLTNKHMKGLRMLDLEDHIVVIGWNEQRTIQLIELIACKSNGDNPEIVLVVDKPMSRPENDSLDDINFHFVTTERYTSDEGMRRACLSKAKTIVIDTECDNDTLTTALYCNKVSPNSHKTAYFKSEDVGDLLKSQCNNIVCIPSVSVEMMAKASTDKGSERLIRQLLDTRYGSNQFSAQLEDGSFILKQKMNYLTLLVWMKKEFDSTVVGIRKKGEEVIAVNTDADYQLKSGDSVFYIARERLNNDIFI